MQPFRCKRFLVEQNGAAHPIGTDSFLLGAWASVTGSHRILDIGTGTGIVSLMLAQRCETARFSIDAVEIDSDSAQCAQRNFDQSPWSAQMRVIEGPIQTLRAHLGPYDLIVSNPPFFTENTVSPLARRRQARSTAALPFPDLLGAALSLLGPNGRFALILPLKAGYDFCEMATCKGLYVNRLMEVKGRPNKQPERLLAEFSLHVAFDGKNTICVHDASGQYSEAYSELTKGFYIRTTMVCDSITDPPAPLTAL